MRFPEIRASFLGPDDLVIDNFAGGGGATDGIGAVIERPVDIAINHDAAAIAMHEANHPETKHYREDIWQVDPRVVCGSRRVYAVWFSPDCTHFSKAKGTQPRKKEIRALANVVIWWAETVRPRLIFLENVEEFQTWGPIGDNGMPIKARAGEDFRAWLGRLSDLGYRFEYRLLVAADYGTPTTRKRLFLVARCDGAPIVWPEPTHGKGQLTAWQSAADIIDWSLPCPSIFDRPRPLVEATMRRIAQGIRRFVIGVNEPFIVRHGHYSTITGAGLHEGCGAGTFRGQPLTHPLATVCATNDKSLVVPMLERRVCGPFVAPVTHQGDSRVHAIGEPLRTVTAAHRGELVLVSPLVTKHFGGPNGHPTPGSDIRRPLGTVTATDHHALTSAFLTKFYGTSTGSDARLPVPTVTAGGGHIGEVRAFLMKYHGGKGGDTRGQLLLEPVRTIDTSNRFGLVMIRGEAYEIVDIGMRMLQPHELFAAQGFRADYNILPFLNGKPISKTQQVSLAGNSVCPPVARQLVRANIFPS
jgi:DNA (cytosine-5)-methyltransferase 1